LIEQIVNLFTIHDLFFFISTVKRVTNTANRVSEQTSQILNFVMDKKNVEINLIVVPVRDNMVCIVRFTQAGEASSDS
jgi:hypothetical protein